MRPMVILDNGSETAWLRLQNEAKDLGQATRIHQIIFDAFDGANNFGHALSAHIGRALASDRIGNILKEVFSADCGITNALCDDLSTIPRRDPACRNILHAFLFYKGYLALSAARGAHWLWVNGDILAALYIQSAVSRSLGVDIHPAAKLGERLVFDHADGLVIGETAQIGNDCVLLHGVTLGSTGKTAGDRHPKLDSNVFVGARATIIGNIRIGAWARIGAGATVINEVDPYTTIVGIAARPHTKVQLQVVNDL